MKKAKEDKKRKKIETEGPPKPVWPPVRQSYKRRQQLQLKPQELYVCVGILSSQSANARHHRKKSRQEALIELGYVQDLDGARTLAEKLCVPAVFSQWLVCLNTRRSNRPECVQEVQKILAHVDEYLKDAQNQL